VSAECGVHAFDAISFNLSVTCLCSGWYKAREIAARAIQQFSTPKKRWMVSDKLTIDKVSKTLQRV